MFNPLHSPHHNHTHLVQSHQLPSRCKPGRRRGGQQPAGRARAPCCSSWTVTSQTRGQQARRPKASSGASRLRPVPTRPACRPEGRQRLREKYGHGHKGGGEERGEARLPTQTCFSMNQFLTEILVKLIFLKISLILVFSKPVANLRYPNNHLVFLDCLMAP